jgi:glycosyltransferase involved in cell wall biosynthesis
VDDPQDLADKIRLLLTDPFLAARLARQALTMVSERFSLDVVARKYAFVFEEVLQR